MADELSNLMENLDSTGNPLASTKALSNTDRSHQYKSKCIDDQRQRRNKLLALQKKYVAPVHFQVKLCKNIAMLLTFSYLAGTEKK